MKIKEIRHLVYDRGYNEIERYINVQDLKIKRDKIIIKHKNWLFDKTRVSTINLKGLQYSLEHIYDGTFSLYINEVEE